MSSRYTDELLNAYIDGDLPEASRREVEDILETSEEARHSLQRIRRLKANLANLPLYDPGDDYFDQLPDRIETRLFPGRQAVGQRPSQPAGRTVLITLIRLAAVITLLFGSFYVSELKNESDRREWVDVTDQPGFVGQDSLPIAPYWGQPRSGANLVGSPGPETHEKVSDTTSSAP